MGDEKHIKLLLSKKHLARLICAFMIAILLANIITMTFMGLFMKFGPDMFATGNITGNMVVDAGGFLGTIEVPLNIQNTMVLKMGNYNDAINNVNKHLAVTTEIPIEDY